MWEPRRLTTLWASTACYRDSFTVYMALCHRKHNTSWPQLREPRILHNGWLRCVLHGNNMSSRQTYHAVPDDEPNLLCYCLAYCTYNFCLTNRCSVLISLRTWSTHTSSSFNPVDFVSGRSSTNRTPLTTLFLHSNTPQRSKQSHYTFCSSGGSEREAAVPP
jgi:hypothetical protein